jgi:drug/metabolite transporter (DMT)-like permease
VSKTGLSRETLGLLIGGVGVVIFGITLPMTRLAVQGLDPFFVMTGRAALAGLIAATVLMIVRPAFPARREWGWVALASLCLVFGFPGFTGYAMQTVPSAHGGVVLGILPLVTAGLSALVHGERPSLRFWLFAVAGAALVVGFTLFSGGGGLHLSMGDLFLVGATLSAATGYIASAELARRRPGWEVISWLLVVSLPVTMPLALMSIPAAPSAIAFGPWIGFAYVTIMSQYIGFFAWNAGLAMGGVARVSQVQLLQSFVTLAAAALILGEDVTLMTWVVAIAVLALVLAGRRAPVRKAASDTASGA